jgi:hypothetical protein
MDWFTILLIFIFFILPLIQQVMEAKRKRTPQIEAEEETGDEEWAIAEDVRGDAPARVAGGEKRTAPGGWSEGWGSWEVSEERKAQAPAPLPREQPRAPLPVERTERPPWQERPERAQRPERVDRVERPRPIVLTPPPESTAPRPVPDRMPRAAPAGGPPQGRSFSPRRPPPPLQPLAVVAVRRGAPKVTVAGLREPGEIRKAIVLNEVLGPPRALRELG